MSYQFTTQVDADIYDEFVKNHPQCSLLQSARWAAVKHNWKSMRVGVMENQQLVGAALLLMKPLPLGYTMIYIPRGPLMDYQNQPLVAYFIKQLKELGKKQKALFIKMDPNIHLNDYQSHERNDHVHKEALTAKKHIEAAGGIHQGFSMDMHATIQPRFQSNVYYVDDFMENLPRHTKKLLKVAIKRHVEIERYGIEMVDVFAELTKKTEARQGVSLRNRDYFRLLMETYGEDAYIVLARLPIKQALEDAAAALSQVQKDIAECPENAVKKMRTLKELEDSRRKEVQDLTAFKERDGDVAYIAGTLSVICGSTCEILYAGTDEWYKKCMAQYYVWPKTMEWAFEKGCQSVNMGGVANTLDDGLTKFKDNFNPLINEFLGEFDIPVNRFLYKPAIWALHQRQKH